MEHQTRPDPIPLLEGWMLGVLLYPCAMEHIADHPVDPTQDNTPAGLPPP